MTSLFLFTLLFLFLLMGVPIAFSLGLSSILTILFFTNDSLASMSLKLFDTMEHYTLLAIPFFILASAFLTTGGVARRLIRFAIAAVGHLTRRTGHRLGTGLHAVRRGVGFVAGHGGRHRLHRHRRHGQIRLSAERYAAGIICNAGTLGILIPPSIVMVVYAAATETLGRPVVHGGRHSRPPAGSRC